MLKPSKHKHKAIEEIPVEGASESCSRRDTNAAIEERSLLPPYVRKRRVDMQEVNILMKACSSLVSLQIPANVPLFMNIIPKLDKIQFEDVDT